MALKVISSAISPFGSIQYLNMPSREGKCREKGRQVNFQLHFFAFEKQKRILKHSYVYRRNGKVSADIV